MQQDDIVWASLNGGGNCAYFLKSVSEGSDRMCLNEYNVSGRCNRASCPLANSQYATVREKDGCLYLYMKVIERSHYPDKLWERIRLSNRYERAIDQIDTELLFWSQFTRVKCKQRLTKLHAARVRTRRLSRGRTRLPTRVHKKVERRDKRKEEKALSVAKIEQKLENELITRLNEGVYGEMYDHFNTIEREVVEEEFEEDIEDLVVIPKSKVKVRVDRHPQH
ncbi:hypothetical protein ACOME3_001413 [Neoechinorhynchus agilis]